MELSVELAKTGRSSCGGCQEKIPQGEERAGFISFRAGRKCMVWFHPPCLLKDVTLGICPTSRGACSLCKEKMIKGSTKLALVAGKGSASESKNWLHVKCSLTILGDLLTKNELPPVAEMNGYTDLGDKAQAFVTAVLDGGTSVEEELDETPNNNTKKVPKRKASDSISEGKESEGSAELPSKPKRAKSVWYGDSKVPPLKEKTLVDRANRFSPLSKALEVKLPTWKLVAYNVNGIRSACTHGLEEYIKKVDTDILCLSETKCTQDQLGLNFYDLGYPHVWWRDSTEKKGYAGSAICSKHQALSVQYGVGEEKADSEGRVISVEFKDFWLVHTYVPNSGEELKFSENRKIFDRKMREHLHKLEQSKPVIWTGDLNVAREDVDVFDGKINLQRQRSAGFTEYEREALDCILKEDGFVDIYRQFYPHETENHFTFFSIRGDMKEKNKGWRLDYFLTSRELASCAKAITVDREVGCSDHVPLILELH